jgi:hypothetical protein
MLYLFKKCKQDFERGIFFLLGTLIVDSSEEAETLSYSFVPQRKMQSQHEIWKQGGSWGSERGLRPRAPSSLSVYWVAVNAYWSWSICGLIVNFRAEQDTYLNFCALKKQHVALLNVGTIMSARHSWFSEWYWVDSVFSITSHNQKFGLPSNLAVNSWISDIHYTAWSPTPRTGSSPQLDFQTLLMSRIQRREWSLGQMSVLWAAVYSEYSLPLIQASLSQVSVILGQPWSENIKWKIPEMSNS